MGWKEVCSSFSVCFGHTHVCHYYFYLQLIQIELFSLHLHPHTGKRGWVWRLKAPWLGEGFPICPSPHVCVHTRVRLFFYKVTWKPIMAPKKSACGLKHISFPPGLCSNITLPERPLLMALCKCKHTLTHSLAGNFITSLPLYFSSWHFTQPDIFITYLDVFFLFLSSKLYWLA